MSDWNSRNTSFDSAELYTACCSPILTEKETAYQLLWSYLARVALQVVYEEPDAEALAKDCAQLALIRIHKRLPECREPLAFRTWSRRIAGHIAIDELRRRKRFSPLNEDESDKKPAHFLTDKQPLPEATVFKKVGLEYLRGMLDQAPISDRSRRVVLGRYLDDMSDEALAQVETDLSDQPVRPSHVQVTRAKNMAKLRTWEPLRSLWRSGSTP